MTYDSNTQIEIGRFELTKAEMVNAGISSQICNVILAWAEQAHITELTINLKDIEGVSGVGKSTLYKLGRLLAQKEADWAAYVEEQEALAATPRDDRGKVPYSNTKEVKMTREAFMTKMLDGIVEPSKISALMAASIMKSEPQGSGFKWSFAFRPETYKKNPKRCEEICEGLLKALGASGRKAWRHYGVQWLSA